MDVNEHACTKSGPLRFSQLSCCWLILSVCWFMSFDFHFGILLKMALNTKNQNQSAKIFFSWTKLKFPSFIRRPTLLEGPAVLDMKIWIYWSKANYLVYFYMVLNKNWKIYWSKQSFTDIAPEERCSTFGLLHLMTPFPYHHWSIMIKW